MKLVKVGYQGGRVTEYALADNATVKDALSAANITLTSNQELLSNSYVVLMSDRSVNNGEVFLVRNKAEVRQKIRVKVARVGERLQEVEVLFGDVAFTALSCASIYRGNDERLFLKKENDPHYDQDITDREKTMGLIAGDILVIEKIKRPTDPRIEKMLHLVSWLVNQDVVEILDNTDEELKSILGDYLKYNSI